MEDPHPIIKKIINANQDTYIIFYINGCPYCENALTLLRKSGVLYKGYDINTIKGGMPRLLEILNEYAILIDFDRYHVTKPIIFLNKKFLGGYDELSKHLSHSIPGSL